jgi:hypothetical protein
MASQGPLSAGSGSTSGSPLWTNPGNITASDDTRATRANITAQTTTGVLTSESHGFTIPSGATIDGIVVEIERYGTGGSLRDSSVRLTTGGTAVGDDKADTVNNWPILSGEAYATYGGATDTWGRSWTDSEINATTFGVNLVALNTHATNTRDAQVDHIRITVYYTEGGGSQTIGMNAISSTAVLYQPAVAPGAVTVETNQIGSTAALYEATVGDGFPPISNAYEPQASSDDGYWRTGGSFFTSATGFRFGDTSDADDPHHAFIRFPDAVAPGAAVILAGTKLTLVAAANNSGDASVRIYGVLGGSPVAPTDETEAEALTLTTAFVSWSPAAWTLGAVHDTPDLTTVIQELVDASDTADGIMLVLRGLSTGATGRVAAGYAHETLDPPLLTIVREGDGSQQVSAQHISSTATLNTPALVYDQPVATNAISSTAALNQPAVTPGVVTVATNAISSTASLHQPSVAPGTVTVAVDELGGTTTVYSPAVVFPTQEVAANAIDSSATLHEPSVTPGAVTVAMNQIASTLALYQPTITTLTTISANLITNTVTLYQPAVTVGTAYISAQAIASALAVYTPLVTGGEVQTTYQVYVEGRVLEVNVSGAVLTVSVAGLASDISVRGSIT